MPHFASTDSLKTFLNADQVDAIIAKLPDGQAEAHLTYADTLITAKSGIVPAGDATDSPILVSIASRIVIWFLSGIQDWNDSNKAELDRRKDLYSEAIAELDMVESGDLPLTPVAADDEQGSETGHCHYRRQTGRW